MLGLYVGSGGSTLSIQIFNRLAEVNREEMHGQIYVNTFQELQVQIFLSSMPSAPLCGEAVAGVPRSRARWDATTNGGHHEAG